MTGSHPRSLFASPAALVLIGLCLGLALGLPKLVAVWQTQAFYDTDDAMHLAQVRDWLAGRGWFDLTVERLDPPQGVPMHWTRVTDVPLALLVRAFGLFTTQDAAERLTRIVYPLLLQLLFFTGIVALARKLIGWRGMAPAVILAAFSVAITVQFPPGRINHHNAQIVLLVFMLGAAVDALDAKRAASALAAGALAALSLSISIEDLPFIAMMTAVFAIAWIARGEAAARALALFGTSFAVAGTAAFAATVPPGHYADRVCDAFAGAHLTAVVVGSLGLLALAAATRRLPSPPARLAAASVAGAAVLAVVALTFPECLKDPFAAVDPVVRKVWLDNVTQTQPMARLLFRHLLETLPMAMPVFLGAILIVLAAFRETGAARARWLVVAAFAAIGVVGTFWEVRLVTYAAAITVFGAAWLFAQLLGHGAHHRRILVAVSALLMVPFVPVSWALIAPNPKDESKQYGDPAACFASSAFTALDQLPKSTLFAPIDAASYLFVFTHHSAIAGPYHRDAHGNRLVIDAFLAEPDKAHDLVRASGARYLILCPAADETGIYAALAPRGLAAQLRDGSPPAWLAPVKLEGTPYRVYAIN